MSMFALLFSRFTYLFASPPACPKPRFLGIFVPWYEYLGVSKDAATNRCSVDGFSFLGSHSGLLLIGLAILDDLVRLAGLVAVGYIIYGGIQYVTSQGSPDATSKARQTIINALIGLVLAIVAAALVSYIGGQLAGSSVIKGSNAAMVVRP